MAPELRKKKSRDSANSVSSPQRQRKTTKSNIDTNKRKATDDTLSISTKKSRISGSHRSQTSRAPKEVPGSEEAAKETEEPSAFESEDEECGAAASAEMMKLIDSDGEDSDADPGEVGTGPIQKVPKVPKHKNPARGTEKEQPGVVYIGRIPHGFYESQMRSYFTQFGDINKLRLSRNKKTGASKHYAFIEFAEESTAEIVVRTMDHYHMYGHILKVKMVPKSQIHPDLWKGCNKRFKAIPRGEIMARELSAPKSEAQWNRLVARENRRRNKQAKKLQTIGYEFEMPMVATIPQPAAIPAGGENSDESEGAAPAIKPTLAKENPETQEKTEEKAADPEPQSDQQESTVSR